MHEAAHVGGDDTGWGTGLVIVGFKPCVQFVQSHGYGDGRLSDGEYTSESAAGARCGVWDDVEVRDFVEQFQQLGIHTILPECAARSVDKHAMGDSELGVSWRLPLCFDEPFGEFIDRLAVVVPGFVKELAAGCGQDDKGLVRLPPVFFEESKEVVGVLIGECGVAGAGGGLPTTSVGDVMDGPSAVLEEAIGGKCNPGIQLIYEAGDEQPEGSGRVCHVCSESESLVLGRVQSGCACFLCSLAYNRKFLGGCWAWTVDLWLFFFPGAI